MLHQGHSYHHLLQNRVAAQAAKRSRLHCLPQVASAEKAHAADGADSSAKPGSGLGQRALGPLQGLLWALKPLMRGALRKTTLLLMFIWFTNALCYYGLVLLTTSV